MSLLLRTLSALLAMWASHCNVMSSEVQWNLRTGNREGAAAHRMVRIL